MISHHHSCRTSTLLSTIHSVQQVWSHYIQKLSHELKSPWEEEPKLKSKEARRKRGCCWWDFSSPPYCWLGDLRACMVGLRPEPMSEVPWSPGGVACPARRWLLCAAHMGSLSSESSSLLFLFICLALCCFINQNLKRRISLLYCHLAED